MTKFKDLILETKKIKWETLVDLQPTNLKNPYYFEILKKSLIKNGFAFSFYAWHNPETGEDLVCDGHSRLDALRELKNDGYDIPDQLNCTFLDLPNKQTAIRYLLEVFNTKKNPIDENAVSEWIIEEDVEDVAMDWLDMVKSANDDDYSILNEVDDSQIQDMAKEVKKSIQIEFTPEDYTIAYELCNFARSKKVYIGEHLINLLKDIKDGYEE